MNQRHPYSRHQVSKDERTRCYFEHARNYYIFDDTVSEELDPSLVVLSASEESGPPLVVLSESEESAQLNRFEDPSEISPV